MRVVVSEYRLLTVCIDRRLMKWWGSRMKEPELIVQYFPDSDTLQLGVREVPAEGETIARWLMVEWSHENEITAVVLRNAAKVLRPYLFPDETKWEDGTGTKPEDSPRPKSSPPSDTVTNDPNL